MHISLTPELEQYARQKVDTGLYNNASEVIREALRLMVKTEQKERDLRAAVTAGFDQIQQGDFVEISSREAFLKTVRNRATHAQDEG